jgi:hypothetical protein
MNRFLKKMLFLCLRMRSDIVCFEGKQYSSGLKLKVCFVGNEKRGDYFIRHLFGCKPPPQKNGRCLSLIKPAKIASFAATYDILMVEINRLLLKPYLAAGFFPIPEWIEFGRTVVGDTSLRYTGASKSLKSDLNRISRSQFDISITKSEDDFNLFYDVMYLPYVISRYGPQRITKSKRRLKKIFKKGFVLFINGPRGPVAGSVVSIERNHITETAIGVRNGSEEIFKAGVSGLLDFYIHQWAADNGKRFINVGHTRPFPLDGVYFNKRKWLMSVLPDVDGVMNIAVKFNMPSCKTASVLESFPFLFQTGRGLNILCSIDSKRTMTIPDVKSAFHRFWSTGIDRLIMLAPACFDQRVLTYAAEKIGPELALISNMNAAVEHPIQG